MLLSKAHIYTRGDRTLVRGGQYSNDIITLTKDLKIIAHTSRGKIQLGYVHNGEVVLGDFDFGPTIKNEIIGGVLSIQSASDHLAAKGALIWLSFDVDSKSWTLSEKPDPTLYSVGVYAKVTLLYNYLQRNENIQMMQIRGNTGIAGWCEFCRLSFPIKWLVSEPVKPTTGKTMSAPVPAKKKTARFVHTSTHDSKVSLVFQLSYILTAYSEAKTTLKELSVRTGVSASALSRIKNGHETGYTLDTVLRIADELDLGYRLVTERCDGETTHHTFVEPAVDFCNRKELKFAAIALATIGTMSHINPRVH